MKRILLLATTTGYQTRSFTEAAKRLDVELVYATDRCCGLNDPWGDRATPIKFHEEEKSLAAIVAAAAIQPVNGILVVGDQPTVLAARAARALGLPGNPEEAARASRDKLRSRECLRAAGLPVPWFTAVGWTEDPAEIAQAVPYPCVVKPLALSGSRGVIRADNPPAFVAAFERLRHLLNAHDVRRTRDPAHDRIMIERFIPGAEFAVEGLLDRGRFQALAVFDKPDPLDGPFFEETIYVTPTERSQEERQAIVSAITEAARALGLHHGPVHAECRVNEKGVFVLEVAARPIGGLCGRSLRFVPTGGDGCAMPLEELLLRHALGEPMDGVEREAAASGVMMIPIPKRGVFRGVEGLAAAQEIPGIEDVRITARRDQLLTPLPEGASYLGFIFARGDGPAAVVASIRQAHACLAFRVDAPLTVVGSSR